MAPTITILTQTVMSSLYLPKPPIKTNYPALLNSLISSLINWISSLRAKRRRRRRTRRRKRRSRSR